MGIELNTFASGDTDYIAKLNANVAELTETINQLQSQMDAVAGQSPVSVAAFMTALFNGADALIGPSSYAPTPSGTTLTVAPGGMYLAADHTTVASGNNVPLNFLAKPAGTYFVKVDISGMPSIDTLLTAGTIYSVSWTGSAFGALVTYIAPVFYDTKESDASRKSLALDSPASPPEKAYQTLDARLEYGEALAYDARAVAGLALATATELQGRTGIRKIGATVDGTTGIKGAIQIDFDGTIIGWSCIADAVGDLQVEVSVKTSTTPPGIPSIPDVVADKISASAPITLTAAQSASSGTSGVSSWSKSLSRWSVVQFRVLSVTTVTRATLYLRVQEIIPVINPLEEVV